MLQCSIVSILVLILVSLLMREYLIDLGDRKLLISTKQMNPYISNRNISTYTNTLFTVQKHAIIIVLYALHLHDCKSSIPTNTLYDRVETMGTLWIELFLCLLHHWPIHYTHIQLQSSKTLQRCIITYATIPYPKSDNSWVHYV